MIWACKTPVGLVHLYSTQRFLTYLLEITINWTRQLCAVWSVTNCMLAWIEGVLEENSWNMMGFGRYQKSGATAFIVCHTAAPTDSISHHWHPLKSGKCGGEKKSVLFPQIPSPFGHVILRKWTNGVIMDISEMQIDLPVTPSMSKVFSSIGFNGSVVCILPVLSHFRQHLVNPLRICHHWTRDTCLFITDFTQVLTIHRWWTNSALHTWSTNNSTIQQWKVAVTPLLADPRTNLDQQLPYWPLLPLSWRSAWGSRIHSFPRSYWHLIQHWRELYFQKTLYRIYHAYSNVVLGMRPYLTGPFLKKGEWVSPSLVWRGC